MGPTCMEADGTFCLGHASIETHGAQHDPECTGEFFRPVLFLPTCASKNESCITDSKRSLASLADRG